MRAKTKLFDFTKGNQGYITLSDDGGFLITVAREGSELSKGFDNLAAAATELAQGQLAEVERLRARLAGLAPRLRLRSPATRAEIQAWAELREDALRLADIDEALKED